MPALQIADLNNAKTDLDKWAEILQSTSATVTLRNGSVVPSRSALFEELNAGAAATETGQNRAAAEAAEINAVAAQALSEAARDVALAAAGPLYADVATGRAAVANGVTFAVQGAGDVAAYIYRRVDASNQTLLVTLPSSSAIPSKEDVEALMGAQAETIDLGDVPAEVPVMLDAAGNVMLSASAELLRFLVPLVATELTSRSITLTGEAGFNPTPLSGATFQVIDTGGFSELGFAVCDASDHVVELVTPAGRAMGDPTARDPVARGAAQEDERFPAERNHFIVNGQSNSIRNSLLSPLADSTDLTFSGGLDLRVEDTGNTFVTMASDNTAGVLWNAMQQMKFLMKGGYTYSKDSLFSDDFTLLASSHGTSGASIAQLSKLGSTGSYEDAMFGVDEGVRLSAAEGKSYAVQALSWIQGEDNRNSTASAYLAAFQAMVADYRADIAAKTGQPNTVKVFTYQPSGQQYDAAGGSEVANTVADAFFQASEADPNIIIATPNYWVKHADALHFDSTHADGGQAMGMKWGEVLYRVIYRGENWRPVEPERIDAYNDTTIVIRFHVPEPPLVLDTDNVVDPGNYGFDVRDDSGTITIESVAVVGGISVRLKLGRALAANPRVSYAYYGVGGNGGGPLTGARGNLRDSAKTVGYNGYARLWNWGVVFTKALPYIKS